MEMLKPTTLEDVFDNPDQHKVYWEENKDFRDGSKLFSAYSDALKEAERIASVAKFYIIENWMKVEDWDFDLNLYSTFDKTLYEFHKHIDVSDNDDIPEWQKDLSKRCNDLSKERHNPIVQFNGVHLDWEGDFSVMINEKTIAWIDNQSIIDLAHDIKICLNRSKN